MDQKPEDKTGRQSVIVLIKKDGERIEVPVNEFLKDLEALKHG